MRKMVAFHPNIRYFSCKNQVFFVQTSGIFRGNLVVFYHYAPLQIKVSLMALKMKYIVPILLLIFYVTPAYAYLDPGTGSILLQGILSVIASVITTVLLYWKKIKVFLKRTLSKKRQD